MNELMEYKGYHAKIAYSADDGIMFGKVIGIADAITFEGENVAELKEAFSHMIDDYLIMCEELQKAPEKEFKGTFNIRITAELHRQAVLVAANRGCTLNQLVMQAIQHEVDGWGKEKETIYCIAFPPQNMQYQSDTKDQYGLEKMKSLFKEEKTYVAKS